MNNEDIQGSPQGVPWNPRNDNYGGLKDIVEVLNV
jgi:hypothetical protein